MSVLIRKRPRKGLPSRSVSPYSFNPGVFLKIGTSDCFITRDDINSFELIFNNSKTRDYGFQVASEESTQSTAPSSPESVSLTPDQFPTPLSLPEVKKVVRKASSGERCCASCGATKTPYWRDAWGENISLCNACGLRYAKFKKRCSSCHYVPRKEDKNGRFCSQCRGSWL